jgi:hypothetical protein
MTRYKVVTPHSSTGFSNLDEARKFAAELATGPDAIRSPSIIRVGTDNAEIPTPKTMQYHPAPIVTRARLGLPPLNRRRTRARRRAIVAAILSALTASLALWAILR